MKTFITTLLFACSAMVTLSGCATAEERAARAAEQALKVKTALTQRRYKIDVNRMYPMNGNSRNVSYGYSVEVRNDTLISYLPYFGRAYNVPYGGGKGLNFSERIGSYHETQQSNGARLIDIELKNDEDIYQYTIKVFDNGNSSIDVQSRQRDPISYSTAVHPLYLDLVRYHFSRAAGIATLLFLVLLYTSALSTVFKARSIA